MQAVGSEVECIALEHQCHGASLDRIKVVLGNGEHVVAAAVVLEDTLGAVVVLLQACLAWGPVS